MKLSKPLYPNAGLNKQPINKKKQILNEKLAEELSGFFSNCEYRMRKLLYNFSKGKTIEITYPGGFQIQYYEPQTDPCVPTESVNVKYIVFNKTDKHDIVYVAENKIDYCDEFISSDSLFNLLQFILLGPEWIKILDEDININA
jgi:hypothetical protein